MQVEFEEEEVVDYLTREFRGKWLKYQSRLIKVNLFASDYVLCIELTRV